MGVFHVFKIVQMLPNRAKHHNWERVCWLLNQLQINYSFVKENVENIKWNWHIIRQLNKKKVSSDFISNFSLFMSSFWFNWRKVCWIQTILGDIVTNGYRCNIFKNRASKICGRQPLKSLKWYVVWLNFFKGCLPQILLGHSLDTMS